MILSAAWLQEHQLRSEADCNEPCRPIDISSSAANRSNGNRAFVTILAGSHYLPAVNCWLHRMRAVGSTFDRIVFYDRLSTAVVQRLRATLQAGEALLPIATASSASAAVSGVAKDRRLYANGTKIRRHYANSTKVRRHDANGTNDTGHMLLKASLWRLTSFERLAYMDLDMLVLGNLDELLTMRLEQPLGAVVAMGWRWCRLLAARSTNGSAASAARTLFNSGMLIFKPDESIADQVDRIVEWCASIPPRVRQRFLKRFVSLAAEPRATDQTYLNHLFAGRWQRLPDRFNWQSPSNEPGRCIRVLHAIGKPKPWTPAAAANHRANGRKSTAAPGRNDWMAHGCGPPTPG